LLSLDQTFAHCDVRAFVQLPELVSTHVELTRKLEELELKGDDSSKSCFQAIKELMTTSRLPKNPESGLVFTATNPSEFEVSNWLLKLKWVDELRRRIGSPDMFGAAIAKCCDLSSEGWSSSSSASAVGSIHSQRSGQEFPAAVIRSFQHMAKRVCPRLSDER